MTKKNWLVLLCGLDSFCVFINMILVKHYWHTDKMFVGFIGFATLFWAIILFSHALELNKSAK